MSNLNDYYRTCDCCGEIVELEDSHYCETCGRSLCKDCVENIPEGYSFGGYVNELDGGLLEKNCPFCNGSEVHDQDLLDFALKLLGKEKEDLKKLYLNKKK